MSNNAVTGGKRGRSAGSHWVRWHGAYEDPSSPLSERLRLVQKMVRGALDEILLGRDQRRHPPGDPDPGGSPSGSSACAPARGET